jgi:hypothetical protein
MLSLLYEQEKNYYSRFGFFAYSPGLLFGLSRVCQRVVG